MDSKKIIRVAAAQIPAYTLQQADQSLAAIERVIQSAGEQEVDLLVLPECAYPAYLLHSIQDYRQARKLSNDEYIIFLSRQAKKKKMHIVSGYVEDVGTHLHNAAILIDAAGQVIGNYRKSYLWAGDNQWFKPGERIRIFDTDLGRVGIIICADARAPEITAKEVIDGAQLIAMPTCWINIAGDRGGFENPQPEYLIRCRAKEFGVPFVCANKFGMESDKIGYCGRSIIVDRHGTILLEAPGNQETLLVRKVELREGDSVHYHDELWESLLHWTTPERTTAQHSSPIPVAIHCGTANPQSVMQWAVQSSAQLLMMNQEPDHQHAGLDVVYPQLGSAIRQLAVGKVAVMTGSDLIRFSRIRLLALGGVEIVCIFDAPNDPYLLRSRAMENRIFLLACNQNSSWIVAPSGEVLGFSEEPNSGFVVPINPAEATNKIVTSQTDIWEQRRVDVYKT